MAARSSTPISIPPSSTTRACLKCSPITAMLAGEKSRSICTTELPVPTPPKTPAACSLNSATGWPSAIAAWRSNRVPRVPRYAFVHGNFALANSAAGRFCGVDSEMQILAETGCYADLTMPTGFWHPAQIGKMNSVYECALPLDQAAPHRQGHDLVAGARRPASFLSSSRDRS